MEPLFVLEIRDFLDSCSFKYEFRGGCFYLLNSLVMIVPVSLKGDKCANETNFRQIKIYEDLWFTKGEIIRNRLKALLGKGEVVFARKCRIVIIDTPVAREFLDNNHILGYSRAKFFYGLFYSTHSGDLSKERLVAVASFSAGRPMKRIKGRQRATNGEIDSTEIFVSSFEWIRYASVGASRVIGGMGRLLNAFVEHKNPQEVMSYADSDWSVGNAYSKLGFELVGKTAPVKFMIDPNTYERYSLKKLLRDRKYQKESKYSNQELNQNQFILLLNSGNLKFIRSFSLL